MTPSYQNLWHRVTSRVSWQHFWMGLWLASWPVAVFLSANVGRLFSFGDLFLFYSLIAALCCLGLFVVGARERIALWGMVGFVLFFSFRDICDFPDHHWPSLMLYLETVHLKMVYVYLFFCAVILAFVWHFLRYTGFQRFLRYSLVSLPFLPWAETLWHAWPSREGRPLLDSMPDIVFKKKPNVYFLMIDGYPREDTLRHVLGGAQGLGTTLKRYGFFVASQSTSNYHFTAASLSSELMMSYHHSEKKFFDDHLFFLYPIVGDNRVVHVFKNHGYDFVFAPSGVLGEMACWGKEDVCLTKNSASEMKHCLIGLTPLACVPMKHVYSEPSRVEVFLKKRLRASGPQKPFFILAHFMQVHDNTVTQDGVSLVKPDHVVVDKPSIDRAHRACQQFDQKIEQLVRTIQKDDPEALIVINSDHGLLMKLDAAMSRKERRHFWMMSRTQYGADDLRQRMNNLIAVYIPAFRSAPGRYHRYFYDDMTPVNIWRCIFSYLSGGKVPLLKDRNFLALFDESRRKYYIREEVTHVVKPQP
ncbi:sulfatase-like hydrolase/transferase [Candidatus Hepatobacter penaei]|uniref:sulfatase-like hydrolase/transferase n=1 Tax=Candidatus Hepatobacter penaei TaxID=1274402 RepID=UPI0004F272AF|nr:sulfatase-like hydrolase/transferase [Candidatus Hepatobacter penaei]